jgi:hypothetical protein
MSAKSPFVDLADYWNNMEKSAFFEMKARTSTGGLLMRIASWAAMATLTTLLAGSAEAMPTPAPYRGDSVITLAAGGCGVGFHRNVYGACVVNGYGWGGGAVVAPGFYGGGGYYHGGYYGGGYYHGGAWHGGGWHGGGWHGGGWHGGGWHGGGAHWHGGGYRR